ncbi:MAG: hypothetical protein AB7E55_01330 [Pigmentiphaga sp.]
MTAAELRDTLHKAGVVLWVEEGRIRYRAPRGVLTPELRRVIITHRDGLRALLREEEAIVARLLQTRGWALIDSAVLGERVVWARDEEAAKGAPEDPVVYGYEELRLLVQSTTTADALRQIHVAKKIFSGRVRAVKGRFE